MHAFERREAGRSAGPLECSRKLLDAIINGSHSGGARALARAPSEGAPSGPRPARFAQANAAASQRPLSGVLEIRILTRIYSRLSRQTSCLCDRYPPHAAASQRPLRQAAAQGRRPRRSPARPPGPAPRPNIGHASPTAPHPVRASGRRSTPRRSCRRSGP